MIALFFQRGKILFWGTTKTQRKQRRYHQERRKARFFSREVKSFFWEPQRHKGTKETEKISSREKKGALLSSVKNLFFMNHKGTEDTEKISFIELRGTIASI